MKILHDLIADARHVGNNHHADQVLALLRRDWSVRVLDECARHRGEAFVTQPVYDKDDDSEGWECSASEDLGWFDLYSDDARYAAAVAMFPTLPDSLRDKLGECP